MNISDFLPFVLPSAKGCPEIVAEFAIRNTIIELCRRALVWTEQQAPIAAIEGLKTYPYATAPQQEVCKLLSVKVNGQRIEVVDPTAGRLKMDNGSTETFAFGLASDITVNSAFTDNLPIVTFAAVCPRLDATLVNDDMARHADAIGWGALYRLMTTPKRDYTDVALAGVFKRQFDDACNTARSEANKGFARAYPRTAAVWF